MTEKSIKFFFKYLFRVGLNLLNAPLKTLDENDNKNFEAKSLKDFSKLI